MAGTSGMLNRIRRAEAAHLTDPEPNTLPKKPLCTIH